MEKAVMACKRKTLKAVSLFYVKEVQTVYTC